MNKKSKSILTTIGFISFFVGLILLIVKTTVDNYPRDWLLVLDYLFMIAVVLSAMCVFGLSSIDTNKATKFFGGFFCPSFALFVVISMFIIVPEVKHVVERDGQGSAVVCEDAYVLNPFTDEVFRYRMGHLVQHDSVNVWVDYNGHLLKFHKEFRDNQQGYYDYVDSVIKPIIRQSSLEYLGYARIDQLQYLYHHIPEVIPDDLYFDGDIGLSRYLSLNTMVGSPDYVLD